MVEFEAAWNRTTDTVEINRIVERHLIEVIDIDDLRIVRGLRCGRTYYAVVEMHDYDEGVTEEPYTIEVPDSGIDLSYGYRP